MPTFFVEIDTDNDAFDPPDSDAEIARILADIAKRIRAREMDGRVRDANGNTVGQWGFK